MPATVPLPSTQTGNPIFVQFRHRLKVHLKDVDNKSKQHKIYGKQRWNLCRVVCSLG